MLMVVLLWRPTKSRRPKCRFIKRHSTVYPCRIVFIYQLFQKLKFYHGLIKKYKHDMEAARCPDPAASTKCKTAPGGNTTSADGRFISHRRAEGMIHAVLRHRQAGEAAALRYGSAREQQVQIFAPALVREFLFESMQHIPRVRGRSVLTAISAQE